MGGAPAKTFTVPELVWDVTELESRLGEPGLKIIDVRVGEDYAMGHIPGALHFSVYGVNTFDTDEAPLESFVQMWAFLLGLRGITADDTIVVYDDISGMSAARAFWFMEYLGHADAHLLDGGLSAWRGAGLPVARDAKAPKASAFRYEAVRERVATYRDVLDAIDASGKVILDTRSEKEWLGTDRRAARGGTIPSAVHLDWVNHLTADGKLKSADELSAMFEARGVTADKEVLAFCNTGYRSAHAYLVLRLLGYPRVRNYVGSWQEWGNRESCPVVVPES
ncbi:MAG: sulfurtransferase [Gammaproteobacteria bacterium]|nr:MAG: sulfurtransferase [Gammaproteobacteria bacterium]